MSTTTTKLTPQEQSQELEQEQKQRLIEQIKQLHEKSTSLEDVSLESMSVEELTKYKYFLSNILSRTCYSFSQITSCNYNDYSMEELKHEYKRLKKISELSNLLCNSFSGHTISDSDTEDLKGHQISHLNMILYKFQSINNIRKLPFFEFVKIRRG
jgi:hypothetical protein